MTVMGNVNAVAVAVLADTACIILTEDSPLDPEAKAKAEARASPSCAAVKTPIIWPWPWGNCWIIQIHRRLIPERKSAQRKIK